jgi:general L-amino acid transport system substrate-binding protein
VITKLLLVLLLLTTTLTSAQSTQQQSTLEQIRARGSLSCGVNGTGQAGFTNLAPDGSFSGFDIDFCKAIAAAIFADATKVSFRALSAQERFSALQSGEVDVLIRNATWTSNRDIKLALDFAPTTFYDGQGFMTRGDANISTLADLQNKTICVQVDTEMELNLEAVMRANGLTYTPLTFNEFFQVIAAYERGECAAWTMDKSILLVERLKLQQPAEHVILADTISKEPLGPIVRQGDSAWADTVRWVIFATFIAEEYGLTSVNVEQQFVENQDPKVQRFLGYIPEDVEAFGLERKAFFNVIKQVGNYAEIYARHFGEGTATAVPRGLNASYKDGGLLYAPPLR